MARELFTFLLAANVAQPLAICESIKHAKKILEFIGEVPEWINYNKNLEEYVQILKRKVECLEGVQADVNTQLDNTELQTGKKRKREVDHWLRSVKTRTDEAKNLEDSINAVSYLPRFLFRAWLGGRIGEKVRQLTELQEQGKFPDGLLLDSSNDGGEPLVTNVLVGQAAHDNIDLICSHLISPVKFMIGVHGPAGIGKSATMAEVYNRLCSDHRVYYVNVPQDFTTYSLQAAIASVMKVSLTQTEGTENRRAARIFNVLKSMKEFVLILDGLSQHFVLEEVGIPVEGNGGKVILTTRCANVCRRMSCQETVVLQNLSTEDSKMLFMKKLAADPPLSEQVKFVARDIIQRCAGVPKTIIDMAVHLRGSTEIVEWQATLNDM